MFCNLAWEHLKRVFRLRVGLALFFISRCLFCFYSRVGSLVRPKVVRSVHYCPATKKSIERRYTDLTSLEAFPSSAVYPTKVSCVDSEAFQAPRKEVSLL